MPAEIHSIMSFYSVNEMKALSNLIYHSVS